ncbi:MAG: 50S ribosomal protein L18 [bacterium]|nr:50S ribosomal protein L18 [bacterium]
MSQNSKREAWLSRKKRVRRKIRGTSDRPRLAVYRSGKHIYAQLIDDIQGLTLAAASSCEKDFAAQSKSGESTRGSNIQGASLVGKLLGERAKTRGVEQAVFDRNGFLYHGRVRALADAVRETGVKF